MPLVAHNDLPTFQRLRERGLNILMPAQIKKQDTRELHIGLLNLMPDAALTATEQQFMGLIGASDLAVLFYVYPFSIPELNRGPKAEEHIGHHYFDFDCLMQQGLDALIITGANVVNPSLDQEPIWEPLIAVTDWAERHVASILCSCLASHALVKHKYQINRQPLQRKQWGVYNHEVTHPEHPLMENVETRFEAPHSRWNAITASQFQEVGLTVLVEGPEAGVHMAVSPDQFRIIYTQGHPEYDANSLLKEYKREVLKYLNGEHESRPPYPEHYLPTQAIEIATRYIEQSENALQHGETLPAFPEGKLSSLVKDSWHGAGSVIVDNWLKLLCQVTSVDLQLQFAPGVDRDDPLQLNLAGTRQSR